MDSDAGFIDDLLHGLFDKAFNFFQGMAPVEVGKYFADDGHRHRDGIAGVGRVRLLLAGNEVRQSLVHRAQGIADLAFDGTRRLTDTLVLAPREPLVAGRVDLGLAEGWRDFLLDFLDFDLVDNGLRFLEHGGYIVK